METKRTRLTLLTLFGIVGILFTQLHRFASQLSWYWQYPWLDNVSHYMGGIVLGLFFAYVLSVMGYRLGWNRTTYVILLCGVAFIGISWEIFEYVFDIAFPGVAGYAIDTSTDLGLDFLGTFTVLLAVSIRKNNEA